MTLRSKGRGLIRLALSASLFTFASCALAQTNSGDEPTGTVGSDPAFETGVCVQYYPFTPTNWQAIRDSGATMVRIDLPWAEIDHKNASTGNVTVRDYTYAKTLYDGATAVGLKVLFILSYGNHDYTGGGQFDPPTSGTALTAFLNYAKEAAQTQFPDAMFEVWNEPDYVKNGVGAFWTPTPSGTAYADFYVAVADAIRSVRPSAKVIFGALANVENPGYSPNASFAWLDAAITELKAHYSTTWTSKIDAISYHAYAGELVDPARVEELTRNVRYHLDHWKPTSTSAEEPINLPIWCTETGVANESWVIPAGDDDLFTSGSPNMAPSTDFTTGWTGYYTPASLTASSAPSLGLPSGVTGYHFTPAALGGGYTGYKWKVDAVPANSFVPCDYYTVSAYIRAVPTSSTAPYVPQLAVIGLQDGGSPSDPPQGFAFLATKEWRRIVFTVKSLSTIQRGFQFFTAAGGPGFEIAAPMTMHSLGITDLATYKAKQKAQVPRAAKLVMRATRDGGAVKAFLFTWQDFKNSDGTVAFTSGLVDSLGNPKIASLNGVLTPPSP